MSEHSAELIEFLKTKSAERQGLAKVLDTNPNQVYVYYVVSAANVAQILAPGGGIRPRNRVPDFVDLSGESVQSRRNAKVELIGDHGRRRWSLPHDCACLFFNPINTTLYAFRRNALVRYSRAQKLERLVCILEVHLRTVLHEPGTFWGVTARNLASGASTSTNLRKYSGLPWAGIYDVTAARKGESEDGLRAAEFVVFPGHRKGVEEIPAHCV